MRDWYALFDDVKTRGGFASDAQLAEALHLTRAQISAWRNGKSDLGTLVKLRILDVLGHSDVRSAVLSLLPERNRDTLIQEHLALVRRVAEHAGAGAGTNGGSRTAHASAPGNRLLAALSPRERERLEPHLAPVAMPLGQVVFRQGEPLTNVYLPTTAIVAIFHATANRAPLGVAVVGNEGLLGLSACIGEPHAGRRAVVQGAGEAFRLSVEVARREFALAGAFQRVMLRYTQALMAQMAQIALCVHHHTPRQQMCRWLLQTLARQDSDEIRFSQRVFPDMLGAHAADALDELKSLEASGALRCRPGSIRVLDRAAIEAAACECHAVLEREYDRIFGAA